jgi:hypothetical protein
MTRPFRLPSLHPGIVPAIIAANAVFKAAGYGGEEKTWRESYYRPAASFRK